MSDAELATVDALVVGGGPAGRAAALWLGRLRCRTVVADRGEPRNRWVEASYGYLGFDGTAPDALLDAGRADLARYPDVECTPAGVRTIHRVRTEADAVEPTFAAELDDRRLVARAVVIATGVADVVPPLPGLGRHYGKQVYVCPLCDGYEVRDRRVAVLGAGGAAGAFCDELRMWTDDLVVVALGDESPADALPAGVTLAEHRAVSVIGDGDGDGTGTGAELEGLGLDDGTVLACDAVFLRTDTVAVTDLAAHLGCRLDDDGLVVVDADGATTVEGVFAAGDCTPGPQIAQVAAAEGARAGLRCARGIRAGRAG